MPYSILISLVVLSVTTVAFADEELARGKLVYEAGGGCVACHGGRGRGDGPAAGALVPRPRDFSPGQFLFDTDGDGKAGTEVDLFNVITAGAQRYGGSPLMAGRPDLSATDRKALVKYVQSLKR